MGTSILVLIAVTTLVACIALGGALYEAVVVDPTWPKRPGIVQSHNGGISRVRFWRPVYVLFELLLVATLVFTWGDAVVGGPLLVALAGHTVMRIWSVIDFGPKASEFEKLDPGEVDEAAATRWTRRSLLRLPLHLVTCAAMLAALAAA
ncbi:MAG: hypothetical protein WBB00_26545 [Mycobacterium sp.]